MIIDNTNTENTRVDRNIYPKPSTKLEITKGEYMSILSFTIKDSRDRTISITIKNIDHVNTENTKINISIYPGAMFPYNFNVSAEKFIDAIILLAQDN